jgi:hypothetical protein
MTAGQNIEFRLLHGSRVFDMAKQVFADAAAQ